MLTYNTMRFGTDEFTLTAKQALLIAKKPFKPNNIYTHIKNFALDYSMPTGSTIRFAFATSDGRVRRVANQQFPPLVEGENYLLSSIDVETILEYGNTVAELLAEHDLARSPTNGYFYDGFMDVNIYPIIALEGDYDSLPKVKLSAVFEKRDEILDKSRSIIFFTDADLTPFKFLGAVKPAIETVGDAEYSWEAFIGDENTDWGDKIPASKIKDHVGDIINQIKITETFHVDAVNGTNSVSRNDGFEFIYSKDVDSIVYGDSADLYSIIKNYFLPLKYCAVIVKHEELNDAKIKAFAKFDPARYGYNSDKRTLGTGSGSQQTFTLPTDAFFDPNTIKVYIDNALTEDYSFDVNDNSVTLTAPEGAQVAASYTYNHKAENWIELTADPTQHDFSDGLFTTRYHCANVKQYGDNVMVSAVRLQFIRGENGNVPRVHSFTAGWAT